MVNYENNTISKSLYRINRNIHPAAGRVFAWVFLHGFLTVPGIGTLFIRTPVGFLIGCFFTVS